ncbi:Trypsin domain containing protein, partial [Asbolus verrucosus]
RVRIIGGQPGSIGQFPFVAAINVQTANSRFFCGGTFFKNQWIITAGQCVDGAILFTINLGSVLLDGSSRRRRSYQLNQIFELLDGGKSVM